MPAAPRLRSACDTCHQLKVRCSGGYPCEGCAESGASSSCTYSFSNRLGRPPGAKTKRHVSTLSSGSSTPSRTRPTASPPRVTPPAPAGPIAIATDVPSFSTAMTDSASSFISPMSISWDPTRFDFADLSGSAASRMNGSKDSFNTYFDEMMLDGSNGTLQRGFDFLPSYSDPTILTPDAVAIDPQLSDEFMGGTSLISPHPTPESGTPPRRVASHETGNVCACLQQHTELLCAIKTSRFLYLNSTRGGGLIQSPSASALPAPGTTPARDSSPSGSSSLWSQTLLNTQEALGVWQAFIDCPKCAGSDDNEVLLLSLMCIRAVLSQLQDLQQDCCDKRGRAASLPAPSLASSGASSPEDSGSSHRDQPQSQRQLVFPGGKVKEDVTLLVGEFEVTGADKVAVLQVLQSATLRKIEAVLRQLEEIVWRRKESLNKGCPGDPENLAFSDQMMSGLLVLLKDLQDPSRS